MVHINRDVVGPKREQQILTDFTPVPTQEVAGRWNKMVDTVTVFLRLAGTAAHEAFGHVLDLSNEICDHLFDRAMVPQRAAAVRPAPLVRPVGQEVPRMH